MLKWPRYLVVALLRGYKFAISPLLPPACRFTPTCSVYAMEAVSRHGVCKGLVLAVVRLGKCHPFHPGGCDPVPPDWSFRQLFSRRRHPPTPTP